MLVFASPKSMSTQERANLLETQTTDVPGKMKDFVLRKERLVATAIVAAHAAKA